MSTSKTRLDSEQVARNIHDGAIEVFASRGWAGFTLDAVGRAAGVGKGSLYRRYRTREELVAAIIDTHLFDGVGIDTGELESDLRALVRAYAEWLDGPGGRLSLRFFLEDRLNDEFRAIWVQQAGPRRATAELFELVERGKRRGEIDRSIPNEVVLHTLLGGVVQQLAASSAPTGEVFDSESGLAYLDALVDSVLRSIRVPAARSSDRH